MVVCTLVQVFLNAPWILVGTMGLYLFITVLVSSFQIKSQNGIRERIVGQKNALDGQICQAISNLEMIRSMNADTYESRRLRPSIQNISKIERRHHIYMGGFDSIKQVCKIAFQIMILIISILLVAHGKMTSGNAITICLLFQQLVKPIDEVYRFMDETASSVIKAKVLLEVADSPLDEVFDIRSTSNEFSSNEIRIENVIVTNPEKNVPLAWYENIVIPTGRIIAIHGPNGCGKSSLIKCLTRYYPYIQGEITIFGKKQSLIDQNQLVKAIYCTSQMSYFIAGTIRENLQYGMEHELSDEILIDALKSVNLVGEGHNDTVIKVDPKDALEFQIGEKADELSGGMKQRLSLARAFLRKPKIFIFDEITANLDDESTENVLCNIERYAKKINAGIIYISHEQKVFARCDEVIEISNNLRDFIKSVA